MHREEQMTEDERFKYVSETMHEKFDLYDHKNIGRPYYFSLDVFFKSVEQMINADEIITAIYMLEHMPGWYRDNPPDQVLEIKNKIYKNLMSTVDYAKDLSELRASSEASFQGVPLEHHITLNHFQPRGELILIKVKELNDKGITPHITEFGPANYWLPYGLRFAQMKFTYNAISLQKEAEDEARNAFKDVWREPNGNDHVIFCCFEVIEHLWNTDDIYHIFAKANIDPQSVMISTPKYTLHGGLDNWDTRDLGHIRTYTPSELLQFCMKHWPRYKWTYVDGNMMVLIGDK